MKKEKGKCKHDDCKYRGWLGNNTGTSKCCDYLYKTGKIRDCDAEDCDKYEKKTK